MIRFGPYQLDPVQGLKRGQREVRLTPQIPGGPHPARQPARTRRQQGGAVRDRVAGHRGHGFGARHVHPGDPAGARGPAARPPVHRDAASSWLPLRGPNDRRDGDRTRGWSRDSRQPRRSLVESTRSTRSIDAFDRARRGTRQVCLISGEPGVGKSAVLAEALARLRERDRVAVTWANCVEQYGSGEPYQPLLDALMRLCRGPDARSDDRDARAIRADVARPAAGRPCTTRGGRPAAAARGDGPGSDAAGADRTRSKRSPPTTRSSWRSRTSTGATRRPSTGSRTWLRAWIPRSCS